MVQPKVSATFHYARFDLLLVLFATACATPASARLTLSGTSWTVATIAGADASAAPRLPSMAFADGRVSGSAGCNAWSGAYTQTGNALRITQGVHTMMACTSGMEVERRCHRGYADRQPVGRYADVLRRRWSR